MTRSPSEREFPVLMYANERQAFPDCPRTIPWAMIEPHAGQAARNHAQTLERLAERGGMGPAEIIAVLDGYTPRRVDDRSMVDELKRRIEAWRAALSEKGEA